MKKNQTILVIVKSRVDVDNYLPIISSLVENNRVKLYLLVLDIHTRKIRSYFNDKILSKIEVISLYSLTKKDIFIVITYYVYILSLFINQIFYRKATDFLLRRLNKILVLLIKNKNKYSLDLDINCTITHPQIYTAIALDRYPGGLFIQEKISKNNVFKVCIEETFNQFNEVKEFSNVSQQLESFCDIFVSNGSMDNNSNVSNIISREKILYIGSPRYAKFWCKKIDSFYGKQNIVDDKEYVKILYLPNKLSKGLPSSTLLDLNTQNKVISNILEQHNNVKIFIKTHPKSNSTYYKKIFNKENSIKNNNVKFLPSDYDTGLFLQESDIVIAPGTSFIPHCLWAGKPVILIGEWCSKQGYTFIYEDLCYNISEINNLINRIIKKESIQDEEIVKKLSLLFECGIKSDLYSQFFENKIRLILDAADTKNINTLQ